MSESQKLDYYLSMINKTYIENIDMLLKKYGAVKDDFFKEKSYNKFLNGEIKSISKGKYSRTSDGLYTHHIGEINHENLSNSRFIKQYAYTFDLQRKENLVYADLIEHLILHALIAYETNGKYGLKGYRVFIEPTVIDWYINKLVPKTEWMRKIYERSFLEKEEVQFLLRELNNGPLKKLE